MQARRTRFIVALLSIGVMQASAQAACTDTANPSIARQHCRHMPCPHRSCCSPNVSVQAGMPESLPIWERPWTASFMASLPARAEILERSAILVPADAGLGERLPEDLLFRTHVLRI